MQPNEQVQQDQRYDLVNFDHNDMHMPLPGASPTTSLFDMNSMTPFPNQNAATSQSMQCAPAEVDSPLFGNVKLSALDQLNIDQLMQPQEASAMIDRAINQVNIHGSGRTGVSPDDIQQIATSSSSRNKGKSRRRKSKTGPTPSIVIIDELDTDNHSQSSSSSSALSSARSTGAKTLPSSDPTRGVRDPNSRVTKRTSPSSSARNHSQSPPSMPAASLSAPSAPVQQSSSYVQDTAMNEPQLSSDNPLGDNPLDIDMLLDDDLWQRESEFAEFFYEPPRQSGDPSPGMPPPCL